MLNEVLIVPLLLMMKLTLYSFHLHLSFNANLCDVEDISGDVRGTRNSSQS